MRFIRNFWAILSVCAVAAFAALGSGVTSLQAEPSAPREMIRQRLDLGASTILLPRSSSSAAGLDSEAIPVDAEAAVANLSALTGASDLVPSFRPARGVIKVRVGVDGAAEPYSMGSDASLEEATLAASGTAALEAMGLNPAEFSVQVGQIRWAGQKDGERFGGGLAWKVRVERVVLGLPVVGDRMTVTYTLAGDFRKVLGRWRAIDYSQSTLTTEMSEESFVERALDALEYHHLHATEVRTTPIKLGTCYTVEPLAPGVFALRLSGFAEIGDSLLPNPDESDQTAGMATRIEFPL